MYSHDDPSDLYSTMTNFINNIMIMNKVITPTLSSDQERSSDEQLLSTDEPTGWAKILLLSIRP